MANNAAGQLGLNKTKNSYDPDFWKLKHNKVQNSIY